MIVSVAATKLEPAEPCAEELARLAQGGEVSAFEAVVGLFGPRLLRYVRQRVGNVHTAEDLVQETFLKAFRGLAGYDSSRSLATWLFTIATRVAISHGRRRFEIAVAAPDELSTLTVTGPDEVVSQEEEQRKNSQNPTGGAITSGATIGGTIGSAFSPVGTAIGAGVGAGFGALASRNA